MIALDDARLAATLRERGYDPGRLIAGEPPTARSARSPRRTRGGRRVRPPPGDATPAYTVSMRPSAQTGSPEMMVVMRASASEEEVAHIVGLIEESGGGAHVTEDGDATVIALIGERAQIAVPRSRACLASRPWCRCASPTSGSPASTRRPTP